MADAQTYDIEATEDDEQRCCLRSLTEDGYEFLTGLIPGYRKGQVVILRMHPDEFFATAPDNLEILIAEATTHSLH